MEWLLCVAVRSVSHIDVARNAWRNPRVVAGRRRNAETDRGMDGAMADLKLNARAARIKVATAALYGEWGGQTKMAASVGISKQMLSFIIHGDRRVTDKVDKAVTDALAREANRLCTTAKKLDQIAGKVQQHRPHWNEKRSQPTAGRTTA
jgi:hypothetical protein